MMPMSRSYHHFYSSSQYGYRRLQMSTYGNQSQRYPHQVRALPGHMWYLPRWYQSTSNTGWYGGEEPYRMKRFQVPPKATSVKIGPSIAQAPQLSESDSPQVQCLFSTNNNKGVPVINPPKPTINLVSKKDIPGGDVTTRWDSKDYH